MSTPTKHGRQPNQATEDMETKVQTTYHAAEVPALALTGDDLILRDPDHPDVEVLWQADHTHVVDGFQVVDYVTEDGTIGRHVFEDPRQMVTVAIRGKHRGALADFEAAA